MVYKVLIGEGSIYGGRPAMQDITPSYTTVTVSASSANTQNNAITINKTLNSNEKLFGFYPFEYKAKLSHIDIRGEVICAFAPTTTMLAEYKLFKKPGVNNVFGVMYSEGARVYPSTIPSEWADYIKDVYMIDYISVDFRNLYANRPYPGANNTVILDYGCNGGEMVKTLRVGYKHENQIQTGTYLMDLFLGTSIEDEDCGVRMAIVYENDVSTDNLFSYQIGTKQPTEVCLKYDGSTMEIIKSTESGLQTQINDIDNVLGPVTEKLGAFRSQYTTR